MEAWRPISTGRARFSQFRDVPVEAKTRLGNPTAARRNAVRGQSQPDGQTAVNHPAQKRRSGVLFRRLRDVLFRRSPRRTVRPGNDTPGHYSVEARLCEGCRLSTSAVVRTATEFLARFTEYPPGSQSPASSSRPPYPSYRIR